MPISRCRIGLILIALLLALAVGVQAQDAPAEPLPAAAETPVEPPTLEPALPTATETPVELLTLEPLPPAATETPVEPLPTETPPDAPTLTPSATAPLLAPEPPLTLIARDLFDMGLGGWLAGAGWSAALEGWAAVANSAEPLTLLQPPLFNAAVQARFQLSAGAVFISLRRSPVGDYSAAFDASGIVTLYRAGVPVISALAPAPPDQWMTLRLSVMDGLLRVAVNEVETLVWLDAAPLPPGQIALWAQFPVEPGDYRAAVDDFFLWIPSAEVGLIATYTPAPALAMPEATPTLVEAATEVPTAPPTPEPILSAPTAVAPPETGKSAVPEEFVPEAGALAAVNDNRADALLFSSVPYVFSDSTTGSSVEPDEPVPACGFNITATVWFKFTPAESGPYEFFTSGSSFDTMLVLWTGDPLPATQINCNDDFGSLLTSRLVQTLNAGQTVWVQVGGYNGKAGNYQFTAQRANLPIPQPPVLSAPLNGALINQVEPLLAWTAPLLGPAPFRYEIQVDNQAAFASPESAGFSTTLSYTAAGLADGLYYWRARSLNVNGGASAWTAARRFTKDSTAPAAPALNNLGTNNITNLARPVLTWAMAPGSGSTGYRVDIARDELFTQPVVTDVATTAPSLSLTAAVLPAPLEQGRFWWRVSARDAAGNWSAESAARSFLVNLASVPAADGFVLANVPVRPTFTWLSAGLTGASYVLEISADSAFTPPLLYTSPPTTLLSHTIPATGPALNAGVYFWRVIVSGLIPPAEVYRAFTVSPTAPPALAPLTPASRALVANAAPLFTWSPVPGTVLGAPFLYQLQVDNQAAFASPEINELALADPAFEPPAEIPDGLYYWRVRAVNAHGLPGPWSASRTFTLDSTAPAAPALNNLGTNNITNLARPVLTWAMAPGSGSTGYRVDIARDELFTQPVVTDVATTAPSLSLTAAVLPAPLEQGRFWWRVSARDAAGNWSAESAARSFLVNLASVPAADGFVLANVPVRPTFTWLSAGLTGASYVLEISADSAFTPPLLYTSPPTTLLSHTIPATGPALNAGVYFWRVIVSGLIPPAEVYRAFTVSPTAPPALAPLTPASRALVANAAPLFTWSPVPGTVLGAPFLYQLQVDNQAAFASPEINELALADPAFEPPAEIPDGLYYWRVRAVNVHGLPGPWSASRTFTLDSTAPAAPALNNLGTNNITNLARPVLTWAMAPGSGSTGYRVDIARDELFTQPVVTDVATTAPSLSLTAAVLPAPLEQGRFWWRVSARDAAGNWSAESAARSFLVNLASVPAADGFVLANVPVRPTFTWLSAGLTGASYVLEISADSAFTPPLLYTSPPTTLLSHTIPATGPALNAGVYFWRVIVSGLIPPAEVYRAFTVSPTAPPALAPLTPASRALVADAAPLFTWSPVPGTVLGAPFLYQLQVDNQAAFASPEINELALADPAFEPPAEIPDGLYYWRVRAVNAHGLPGPWSASRTFTLDSTAPAAPALSLPLNDAIVTLAQPTFTWLAVSGGVRYDLQLSITPAFTTPLTVTGLVRASFMPPGPLLVTTYYWRVRVYDAAGNVSDWSPTRSVKVASPTTTAPLLNRYTSPPTLSWAVVSWALGYELVVDDNADFSSPVYRDANLDSGTLSVAMPASLPDGVYFWRVRARSGPVTWGSWSTGMFQIQR